MKIDARYLVLMATLTVSPNLSAAEPWSDGEMKVTEGLELWLDANAIDRARSAEFQSPMKDGSRLGDWPDSSGHGRHASQRLRDAQPIFRRLAAAAAIEFDGRDDFMSIPGIGGAHQELTVFVLVAPRSNPGGYRAILSGGQAGRNDFATGINIDLGAPSSKSLDLINVEGAGFSGARDLLEETGQFGQFQVIAVTALPEKGIIVHFHGRADGRRDRQQAPIHLEEIYLGARSFSNADDNPFLQGFFDGQIAEVLVYNRALSNPERKGVEAYLAGKRQALHRALAQRDSGYLLTPVKDAPAVQMLVPGFTVRKTPLELTNIDNVRYRADGKLVALAYNGNVWLLSDTDGDGLEDKARLFWDNEGRGDGRLQAPIGMALTPPGYKHGQGLFAACKGKLSLIVDTDGDDKADKQIVVAQGWPPSMHQVDALGVAIDREGYIYFGLGTPWFADPYLIDKETGKARFDIHGERGTILKVWPDFSKREVVCTGIRFPVGLAFNREGGLFATDQEGATWMPNGNPLDELLHIQPGRHYGFPPKHPRCLPEVPGGVDEPSTFDYGPQHQSTCGLVFNESVNGGPVFGPDWWAGDAIVCGESRGKIWRTKLVKTSAGYVAHTTLLACLNMLTVDSCVSPRGDLVVACHSGAPDWGAGPTGKGTLFKISYTDRQAPQPVLAYPTGPRELHIAFDRPLRESDLSALHEGVKIEYGEHVRAGDRFETMYPGYAVVERQRATPRFFLKVHTLQVTPDRRTLVLMTDPHPRAAHYALTLPTSRARQQADSKEPDLLGPAPHPGAPGRLVAQHPTIDLHYDLTGVQAQWTDPAGKIGWSGWLPHIDLSVCKALTAGSAEHEPLWDLVRQHGHLKFTAKLYLENMLHPAIQPGSKIDFAPPAENITVKVLASGATGASGLTSIRSDSMEQVIETGPGKFETVEVSWTSDEDRTHKRPLPLHRLGLPWAPRETDRPAPPKRQIPEIAGGDWLRGREVFFSDQALCSRCHRVRGQGGYIGPDLSNLTQRDYASVLRDIENPSAALNPEHIAYTLKLSDGRSITGVTRNGQAGQVIIGDATGAETLVHKESIASMEPLAASIMPPALNQVLGKERFRDLMTFLLTEPPEPAKIQAPRPPEPRKRAEIKD